MKTAYVTSMRFTEYEGRYYHPNFNHALMQKRYLPVFEDLTLIAIKNQGDAGSVDADMLADGEGVQLVFPESWPRKFDFLLKRRQMERELTGILEGMDAVIIRSPCNFGYVAGKICRKYAIPHLVESGGCSLEALWNHSLKGKLLAPMAYLRNKNCIKHADYVVYASKSFLQRRYPTNGVQTNCSNVFLEHLDASVLESRQAKIRAMKPDAPIVLGSVGKIDLAYKGHKTVVQAIAHLKKQGKAYRYEIVGKGDPAYIMGIARQYGVEDSVSVLGGLSHEQVLDWLDTVDIYIQPSITEGLPRALIEAMSRATPCIGSNAGGIPELLEEAYLFPKKNWNRLSERLIAVQENLTSASRRCFETSKEYKSEVLEQRRRNLFEQFRCYAEREKK